MQELRISNNSGDSESLTRWDEHLIAMIRSGPAAPIAKNSYYIYCISVSLAIFSQRTGVSIRYKTFGRTVWPIHPGPLRAQNLNLGQLWITIPKRPVSGPFRAKITVWRAIHNKRTLVDQSHSAHIGNNRQSGQHRRSVPRRPIHEHRLSNHIISRYCPELVLAISIVVVKPQ